MKKIIPAIIREGRDYYMTHSSLANSPGLLIWHSRDLVNWEPVCHALREAPGTVWAPELCKVGDTYYIYFPTEQRENYVITAKSIEGPWSEPVALGVSGFDPGHVMDTDGTRYIYLNRGRVVRLSPDGMSAIDEPIKVYDGWSVLTEKDGVFFRSNGLTGNYEKMRDARNPLLWSRFGEEFEGDTLYSMAATDTSYSITATFTIGENAAAGAYLFYNGNAFYGKKVSTPGNHSIRIINRNNTAELWYKGSDGLWVKESENVDVSDYHHNLYRGFSALRPSYLLHGDATLDSFEYSQINTESSKQD